jgi:SNF family Na+-dependent transporter
MKENYAMDDFFTAASFATLTGSVASVVVIVNVFRHVFNWGPRWFGLILSIVVAVIAWHIAASAGDQSKTAALGLFGYFIVFVNGCLIYTSAFGIQNSIIGKPPNGNGSGLEWQGVTKGAEKEKPGRLTLRSYW